MSLNTFFVPLDTISKQLNLVIHSSQDVSLVRDQNKKILISCPCSNWWQIMLANLSRFIVFFFENSKCFVLKNKTSTVKNPVATMYI